MVTLEFRRKLAEASQRDIDALNRVPGLGTIYPGDRLSLARLEDEVTRPKVPTTRGTVTSFFLLADNNGGKNIEIVEQLYHGVWNYAGSVNEANLTIEDAVVNGHYVLSSLIDGQKVDFVYDSGTYVAATA
jgi:hypothetical protein